MLTIEMTKKMIAPDQSVLRHQQGMSCQHPVFIIKILGADILIGRKDVHF